MTRRPITLAALLALALTTALFLRPASDTLAQTALVTSGPSSTAESSLDQAEALFAEGSFALAHDIFLELDQRDLGEEQNRWIDFRVADSAWRSLAATATPDTTELDRARQALDALVRDISRDIDRDRVWVEVQESLGDFAWARPRSRNWGQAWNYYRPALEWWGRSGDLELARERYLKIVWRAARPPQVEPYYYYGYHGNQLPDPILRNVLRISDDPRDRAHAWFLIAMNQRHGGGSPSQMRRVAEAFEAALEPGRGSGWYDDALFHYADWLTRSGRAVTLEGGGWRQEPDYVRAVEMFRRLTREFAKGETRHYDQARAQIETILAPQVGVAVPSFFVPGSVVQYQLQWRNVRSVELALYTVELTEDIAWGADHGAGQWLQRIDAGSRAAALSWTWETNDRGLHMPGNVTLDLDDELGDGAYLLEVTAGGETARELVLVTQASLVLKSSNRQLVAYLCDAVTGAPRADSRVALSLRSYDGEWRWSTATVRTDDDGLARFDLPASDNNVELFVAAADGEHQAFATSNRWSGRRQTDGWKLYVFTDRPAYRPGETSHWKVVARLHDGSEYTTPSGQSIGYEITDSRGARVDEGSLELNSFGSAWGEIALGAQQPLGEYRIGFRDASGNRTIGNAVLLRLEEYKLPEFRVEVGTPEEDGKPRALLVGEPVEADVSAQYYFGGPVAEASVEVLVYQKPLRIYWQKPREFPWFYEDMNPQTRYGWGGQGSIVHRETLKTDADGRATIRFEPPFDTSQDFEYTIEARVTDASRREIVGRGTVRASRQRYFAFLHAAHNLYRPGDDVRVTIKTIDANREPHSAEGRLRVTRDRWIEHNGYEHEEILSQRLTTDENGEVELSFTPRDDGYYRIAWSGDEDETFPVRGETTVWVADPDTVDIGYRPGGVQVLVDRDTFQVGRRTPVMISTPTPDSWVLFSVEGDELYDYRVVHLTGSVKLIELDIEERHVPNVFLDAAMVRDGELFVDSRQVVVPPVEHFLEVEIAADREEYGPRDSGTLTVTTRDHEGNPVAAEVALALVDESVFYIQSDRAGDPRQFFYGSKRQKSVLTQSSFHVRRYAKLAKGKVGDDKIDTLRRDAAYGLSSSVLKEEGSFDDMRGGGRMRAEAKKMATGIAMEADEAVMNQAPAAAAPADISAGQDPAVQVRSDFRTTASWTPDVVTGEDGTARVELSYPDSLTTWKATARVATSGNRFGQATSSTRTSKPIIVRLQAPRFFVVGDRATVSAIVNNNTESPLEIAVALDAAGLTPLDSTDGRIRVPAGGEERVDWAVAVRQAGDAKLTVVARADGVDDAMVRDYPVYEHGIEKFVSRSGKVRGGDLTVTLDLPRERRDGSTLMSVQITPSMAVTMLDALPYLIDYPYGCTEQTMSRFLPAVITGRTLERLGLEPRDVAGRLFGGIEQEHTDRTHADGQRDLGKLDDMVRSGLRRLADFQHGDGGWGWWKGGESDHFMTAYVVWGLALARDAGVAVDNGVLRRGAEFLDREIVEAEQRPDLQSWMLHALSAQTSLAKSRPSRFQTAAFDNLWDGRDRLNAYSRALLALSAHHMGDADRARTLVRNLTNGVQRDRSPDTSVVQRGTQSSGAGVIGTAHWGADGIYRRWSDGPVETTSFALRALIAIDPANELIEPVTNWLVRNRRGAQWSNTRDTAIAVLALGDYLSASGELGSRLGFEVLVNGHSVASKTIEPNDVLRAPSRFEIDPAWLRDGANQIEIVRTSGDAPIYFSVDARYFSLEEPITPAGNEIFVRRGYEKLVGKPTLLAGYVYDRKSLVDGGRVTSGERVEVSVIVEAKNDYEYLVFEDLKPAGLEAVQLRSGEAVHARELTSAAVEDLTGERAPQDYTGRTRWVHQELRDRKIGLFIDKLPQGVWEIRYELRAEVPGRFHALPVMGHAMYVPEIRCNGAEVRLEVVDR